MSQTQSLTIPNQALTCFGLNKVEIRSKPLLLPRSSNGKPIIPSPCVLVRIRATGICGSDIHLWKEGSAVGNKDKNPYVMGHECAGEIIGVADDVKEWIVGDRIAIKPGLPCLKCIDCTKGASNLCPNITYFGIPGCDGSCCDYKVVPERQLVRLTSNISWTEAGLIQPLAISLQMSRQAALKAHQHVMILGGGCIGLMLGAMAKAFGAAKVVVLEKTPHRAAFARTYCANQVFENPPYEPGEATTDYATRVSKHIMENVPGIHRGFDVCIEAAGEEECMQMGIKLCKPNGTYVQVGMYRGQHPRIPMIDICVKQLNVKGTFRYTTNCFEEAVDLIDRGVIDAKGLVSHVYDFKDSLEAFESVHNLEDRHGKKMMKTVILHGSDGEDLHWTKLA